MTSLNFKNTFRKEYKYKLELHAHTAPASICSQISPQRLVELYSSHGYHGIVISNHYNTFNISRFPKLSKEEYIDLYIKDITETEEAAKKYGIKIYWGAELRFDENMNDYLLYGVDHKILCDCYDYLATDLKTFRKKVLLPKSVLIHAHPFRMDMTLMPSELLDGIEILNLHPGHNSAVSLATRYAYETNAKIKTAGSDFHEEAHLGSAALLSKTLPEDSFELAELLKSGDYLLEIGENAIVIP